MHATTNNPIDWSANGPLPSTYFRDVISIGSGCGRAEHQREQLDYHNQKSSCSERVFYRRHDACKCGSIHSVCLDGSHTWIVARVHRSDDPRLLRGEDFPKLHMQHTSTAAEPREEGCVNSKPLVSQPQVVRNQPEVCSLTFQLKADVNSSSAFLCPWIYKRSSCIICCWLVMITMKIYTLNCSTFVY